MASAAPIPPVDESAHCDNVMDHVRGVLMEVGNSRKQATDRLVTEFMADPEWIRIHLEKAVRSFTDELVHKALNQWRNNPPSPVAVQADMSAFSERLRSFAAEELKRAMETPIWGGKRLGDSTIAEVRESASQYAKLAKTAHARAMFFTRVADEAERQASADATTIRTILRSATVDKLWEETHAQTE